MFVDWCFVTAFGYGERPVAALPALGVDLSVHLRLFGVANLQIRMQCLFVKTMARLHRYIR